VGSICSRAIPVFCDFVILPGNFLKEKGGMKLKVYNKIVNLPSNIT
jgi:hypothetical protein